MVFLPFSEWDNKLNSTEKLFASKNKTFEDHAKISSPRFSVVIPLYNKAQTIERAVRSVLNQTLQDFEIIVVNDGSTDHGPQLVEAVNDQRIRTVYQENQGVSAARNRGIMEAKAELIAFLDADDEWMPDFLKEICLLCQEYPGCGLYATRYFFRAGGKRRPAVVRSRNFAAGSDRRILSDYFETASASDPPVWSSALCAKKEALLAVGGFPNGVTSGEDLLTWARLAVRYSIAYSMKCLSIFWLKETGDATIELRRAPDLKDAVGKGLRDLLAVCPSNQLRSLRRYIACWYKMRLSVFLRTHERRMAWSAWLQSLRFNAFQPKLWPVLLIVVLPFRVRMRILGGLLRPV